MTRQYELVYIFDSTLEEAQVNERLERFHTLTKTPEAAEPVTSASHWGKRTLAYPIKGKETGYYVVEQFETNPELLGELERALPLFAEIFVRGENWRELTPRLVPPGFLDVDEAGLGRIMAAGR